MGWEHQRDSLFKCLIYFDNGLSRTFYSYDWKNKNQPIRDPDVGLERLRKFIDRCKANATTAVVYDNITKQRIEQYYKGIRTF